MSDVFDARKDVPAIRKANAAFIASLLDDLLPPMRMTARGLGYALTVHGTLSRDVDLVAIPWTVSASEPELLVKHLCGVIAGVTGRAYSDAKWADKPHGRRAVTIIHGGHDAELDLSIMPRVGAEHEA